MFMFPESPGYVQALQILNTLREKDFPSYLVGGCVRDALQQRTLGDFDICSSAKPHEIQEIFPKTVDTGSKWGTITIIHEGNSYEHTTFRGEGTYTDQRHPETVSFTNSLAEDLQRRDFTINSMAYHPEEGVIDPYGGQIDLEEKILKTVGNPLLRFKEDYLRILRALRFVATHNLNVEKQTEEALLTCYEPLKSCTRERLTQEIKKLVLGNYVQKIAPYYGVLEETVFLGVPCLWEAEGEEDIVEKLEEISKAPQDQILRLAMFVSLFAPSSDFFRLSKVESKELDFFCTMPCLAWENQSFFRDTIQKHGRVQVKRLLFYQKHQFPYHKWELEQLEQQLDKLTATTLEELAINGQDLIDRGVKGEMIGKLLQSSLKLVISQQIPNEKDEILETIFGRV